LQVLQPPKEGGKPTILSIK